MTTRIQSPIGPRTILSGREYDYFSGTGYLGLQSHPDVMQTAQDAIFRYGFSTVSSRGGLGEHPLFDELEKQAALFFKAEKILHFASGYMGINILTQISSSSFDHIFIDNDAHFSLWDAAQASNKVITPFHHLSPEDLAGQLKRELQPLERPLILSDGVFPVSGEIAPLPDYLQLVKPLNGQIYLDDAHAVGVLGTNGNGTADYFQIQDDNCRTSGTLAKALGGYGGILWGKANWIDKIDQNSRFLTGSSPLPIPVLAASAKALEIARLTPQLRSDLQQNVMFLRNGLNSLGFNLELSPIPIICIRAEADLNLDYLQAYLFKQDIAVTLVRGYTSSPAGGALRIAVFANHTRQQLEKLLEVVKQAI